MRLRCSWEVVAGLIPGQPMHEHTRQWHLTSEKWADGKGFELFLTLKAQADAYAAYLQILCANGREVNWTRTDFVWY